MTNFGRKLSGKLTSKIATMNFGRKLSKLTIYAYSDRDRRQSLGHIEAMYNPSTIDLNYHTDFVQNRTINSQTTTSRYDALRPGVLTLELIFDAHLPGNNKTIDSQLSHLRSLCSSINQYTGETNFLHVMWGKMSWHGRGYFAGRMASMNVHYSLFDRDATPLRATVSLSLMADDSLELQQSLQGMHAPQSMQLKVPDMSTLPLIAATASAALGGATMDYLSVAVDNKLDNLSAVSSGKKLLAKMKGRR